MCVCVCVVCLCFAFSSLTCILLLLLVFVCVSLSLSLSSSSSCSWLTAGWFIGQAEVNCVAAEASSRHRDLDKGKMHASMMRANAGIKLMAIVLICITVIHALNAHAAQHADEEKKKNTNERRQERRRRKHPGFLTEEDGKNRENRRSLQTLFPSACLPSAFDVDCFLSGGECTPRTRCTGFSSAFRIASAADAGARGRGMPRVFDEIDEEMMREAGGEELASTARFTGCPGFDCSCCLPCRALTPTVQAVQCALAGGECSTRLDCALREGRFDPTGCGFFSAKACGCCILEGGAPPVRIPPPPPPLSPPDPVVPSPPPDPVVPAPPPPDPANTCESGGREGTYTFPSRF